MTTSPISTASEIRNPSKSLSPATMAYFQERLRNRLFSLVLEEYAKQNKDAGLTQKALAARIGKGTDQVCRWLAAPGNWTIDTLSDLLLGISGSELALSISHLSEKSPQNFRTPDWLLGEPSHRQSVLSIEATARFSNYRSTIVICGANPTLSIAGVSP